MNDDVKFRHELKYLISAAQVKEIQNRLNHMIPLDSHVGDGGIYNIRSLYFDDYNDRCLHENEDGTDPREKFRIRIYNHSPERISLECKRKERGKTLKTSCRLTQEETRKLMRGEALTGISDMPPVCRKFTLEMMTNRMHPVVIVEYERIPYVYKNGNVRITLDMNMSSSSHISGFLDGEVPKRPIMPAGMHLLEVKYDEYLPDFIYHNLQLENLRQTAYSKYYLCRKYAL